jgi:hypothetical protein
MSDLNEMNVTSLRRRAKAVYLAADEGPATDISKALLWSADRIEALEAALREILAGHPDAFDLARATLAPEQK